MNKYKVRRGTEKEYTVYELLIYDDHIMAIKAKKYLDRIGGERTREGRTVILRPSRELCGWWFDDFTVGKTECVYSDEIPKIYKTLRKELEDIPLDENDVVEVVDEVIGKYNYYRRKDDWWLYEDDEE